MCMYPVSIPVDGCGLNFTGVSYNGVMWVSMVSCRSMVPDPGVMLDCMREAWDELLAAADALPSPHSLAEAKGGARAKAPASARSRARTNNGAKAKAKAGAKVKTKPTANQTRRVAPAAAPGKPRATARTRRRARVPRAS